MRSVMASPIGFEYTLASLFGSWSPGPASRRRLDKTPHPEIEVRAAGSKRDACRITVPHG